jgi:hypothetical protein
MGGIRSPILWGLMPLAIPVVLVIIFGFVLEWISLLVIAAMVVPAPLIAFFGAFRPADDEWRRQFRNALVASAVLLLVLGPLGIIDSPALIVAFWLGRAVRLRRETERGPGIAG